MPAKNGENSETGKVCITARVFYEKIRQKKRDNKKLVFLSLIVLPHYYL